MINKERICETIHFPDYEMAAHVRQIPPSPLIMSERISDIALARCHPLANIVSPYQSKLQINEHMAEIDAEPLSCAVQCD